MQKFSELIKKSTEDGVGKKKPAVQKGRFKIAKSDDDKMLAFGWANVSITADGGIDRRLPGGHHRTGGT